jgi:hypothetical protein
MRKEAQIKYLTRTQIRDELWNGCIDKAGNGLIYGYSFYLDHMADNWDALVLNNYEAVMPLPWRKKWSVYYLYQPFLTAQLGVFGNEIDSELLAAFLFVIPKKFEYWDFSLNHQNLFALSNFPLFERSNYILPLTTSYETLYKSYRENIRRNCRKTKEYGCTVTINVSITSVIALTKLQDANTSDRDFENFEKLYHLLKGKGIAKTYGILSKTGDLLASCVFVFSHNRAYYILVGNHPNGRTLGASHAMIDAFIKDHAGQNLILDFEGSDVRNLAFFYSSFGAAEEKYAAIKLNRLPWWAAWMK